jgi:hypothetical protein
MESPRETCTEIFCPGFLGTQLLFTEISFSNRFSSKVEGIRLLHYPTPYCDFAYTKCNGRQKNTKEMWRRNVVL